MKRAEMDAPESKTYEDGVAEERKRIREWVLENRSVYGDPEEPWIIRDHFQSDDLLRFLDGEK